MPDDRGARRPDLRLIVITDAALARPRTVTEVLTAALEAGAPAIQLRDTAASAAELYQRALALRDLTRRHGALLFINDRADVALAAEADGVHLGPDDLPVAAARRAANAAGLPLLIGRSADTPAAARRARADGADYIGCGAVFGSTSKDVGDERIGTRRLADVVRAARVPVVGIGGITPDNAPEIAAAGAAGCAVISAVMAAPDVGEAVRRLLEPFRARETREG